MKHRLLSLTALAVFAGYLPWYAFSAVVGFAAGDLGLSPKDVGTILAAFQAGYVVMVIPLGYLADRYGPKRIIETSLLSCGLSCIMTALAPPGVWPMALLRALTGGASAGLYAPAMGLLRDWHEDRLSYPYGLLTAALTGSYALTFAVAGPLTAFTGWRAAITAAGVPALLAWLLLKVSLSQVAAGRGRPGSTTRRSDLARGFRRVFGSRAAATVTLAYLGHMWEQYGFWAWVAPFFVSRAIAGGMSTGDAQISGSALTFFTISAGIAGVWLWSLLATRLSAWKAIGIAGAASALGMLVLPFTTAGWACVVAVWCGFWVIADSALFKVLLANVEQDASGLSTGLAVQSAAGFGASAVSPYVLGLVLTLYNGPGNPVYATVWHPAFIALAVGGLLVPATAVVALTSARTGG